MPRTNPYRKHKAQLDAMHALQAAVDASGIDPLLAELCKIRASQINGCAFCLAMHTYESREKGETEARIHLVAAWREARPYFTPAEQAALALTEAVTLLPGGVPDDVWAEAVARLGEDGANDVLWLLVAINAWNRLNVAAHTAPGHWKDELSAARAHAQAAAGSTASDGSGVGVATSAR
jgi:AhpD family alkylhydroperoxidase